MEYKLENIAEYVNEKIKISEIENDSYISTENMLPNKNGIVRANKELNLNKVNYFKKGDILISNIRPYFKKIWYATFDGGCSNDVLIIRVKDQNMILSRYLYYLLYEDNFFKYIMSGSKGTKMPRGDKKQILRYMIKVPTLKEQNKIVNIIDVICKKIELNTQINNNLYEIIKVQYNNFMSKLIEYDLVKLKDIAIISSGKRPKTKGKEYKIPLIGASGIMSYTNDYNSDSDILVIGRVGTLGVVQRYFDKVWLSDNIISIKTKYMNTLENYFKYVDYQSLNRGSTQPLITQTDISNLEIKFNKKKFVKFENEMRELRKKIELNNEQSKVLEKLKDTLLPKLLNGKINLDKIKC